MENTAETITVERSSYESMQTEIAELRTLLEWYKSQLLSEKRNRFGSSSERTDIDLRQLSLFGEEDVAPPPEPETEEITYKRKKQKGKREADLSGLPVERIDYELSESERICPECGETMRDIGVDVRRELKLIPAKVVVLEHAAHAYACRNCTENGISTPFVKAEAPAALIQGSLASPSLVAHIAAQKYVNGMPLYRIEKGFSYDGVDISRQTMSNWVIQCSEMYLEPICDLLRRRLLEESVLHADETTARVLREPNRAAETKSYEWVYRTGAFAERKISIYDYKMTREQEHPKTFLKDFKGFLHTDGYQVYHNLPPGITVIGCFAHVRRKFEDLLKKTPKAKRKGSNAEKGVAYINALFRLEREIADLTPEERLKKRLEKGKPISDAFFAWAGSLGALPKTPLGKAVGYALSQRPYLENIYLDGRTEISNNRCERAVKPFVMGRKNWLFSNTPSGAVAGSVMYSILETAKENGLHPFRYMEFLLETLPNAKTPDLESLLPWSETLPERCRSPVEPERRPHHSNTSRLMVS
jgi:transposase